MSASKAFHEEFAARVIAMLENGPAKELAPYNPISGVTYRGGNRLWLSMLSTGDPRWMTFKQAVKAGYKIRKGSKSVPIEYFVTQVTEDRLDENGRPVLDEDGNPERVTRHLERPMLKIHRVFNAQDVEGLPPLEVSRPLYEWEPLEKAEEILSRSGAVIKHDQADRAFYSIARDEIHLPPRSNFDAPDKYYATALHELGHWTGHESRMDRPFGVRGSEGYAKEELRAEIASWMLGQDIGVGHDPGQHAAYVQSWIADLKDDPLEILRACRDAEHIKEYLMGLEREHSLQTEREADTEKGRRSVVLDRGVPDAGREPSRAAPASEKTWLAVPYSARREAKAPAPNGMPAKSNGIARKEAIWLPCKSSCRGKRPLRRKKHGCPCPTGRKTTPRVWGRSSTGMKNAGLRRKALILGRCNAGFPPWNRRGRSILTRRRSLPSSWPNSALT